MTRRSRLAAFALLIGGLIAALTLAALYSWPSGSRDGGEAARLVLFDGIDNEKALKSVGWVVAGEFVGILSDAELRFVNDVEVVESFHNRTNAAVRLLLGDTGGGFEVPPSRRGYVLHAPAAASVLLERMPRPPIESRRVAPSDVVVAPSDDVVVSSVADIPRGSRWTPYDDSLAFTTTTQRQLRFPQGVRVLASGRGPLNIEASNGISLEVPAGEWGYVIQPKEF